MTTFLMRMREELVRRNYAESTIRSYLRIVEDFHQHAGKRLDYLGPDDIRYLQTAHLGSAHPGRVDRHQHGAMKQVAGAFA